MNQLTNLPNIGKILAEKLNQIGIYSEKDLKLAGSENAFLKISTIDKNSVGINILYALEGAIQGIRWHNLEKEKMQELLEFFRMMKKKDLTL